ncbi:MAG TPA: TM0106 family RecB-like putative nuclease [Gemmatimonadaceae bacterium]|jgi:uncharacterized protein
MRHYDDTFLPSATDLAHFLGCRHRAALEMQAATGAIEKPHFDDPILELLFKRGTEHEKAHVRSLIAAGRNVVDLSHIIHAAPLIAATLDAMRSGADIIVQGALRSGIWYGKPDLLQRVEQPSNFGAWSYEVADTKLALETRAGTILQLSLYSAMLAEVQGVAPACFYVVTPDVDHPTHVYRVDDYAAYFRFVRDTMAGTLLREPQAIADEHYPEPVELCDICTWAVSCRERRRTDDHLSLVAGITRIQRRELTSHDTTTLTSLASLGTPIPFKPDRGSRASYERVREQARLQVEARSLATPPHELREIEPGQGLCLLPEPTAGDVFLDLEGDHLGVEGGREYLFGVVTVGASGAPEYEAFWASNDREERRAFEAVMDLISARIATHPEMHVFHYAPYEVTAFRRLMGRYATREDELDAMLRAGRFVDLYAVVRQSMLAGIERYSIKNLESMYGFARDVNLKDAGRNLRRFEYALALNALDALPREVRDTVVGYNRDDCVSTLRLRDWLETLRADAIGSGMEIPRPTLESGAPSAELGERQKRVEALRERLLDGREDPPPHGTPEHARFLLAYLLDFHRREAKASWARFFQRCVAPDEDLLDDSEAVVELQFVERIERVVNKKTKRPTGSVIDRYAYPEQEMEIRAGSTLMMRDQDKFGEVIDVDRNARTIDVKSKELADAYPRTAFVHDNVPTRPLEDALERVAGEVVNGGAALEGANDIVRTLLLGESPRLVDGAFHQPDDDDTCAFAVDVVTRLDRTVLAIQGPPGSGKTYTGARMILAAIAAGKRVGVSGPSHKVITNLLMGVAEAARTQNVTVRIGQKVGEDGGDPPPQSISPLNNDSACAALRDRELDVVGGTAWLWARPEMRGCVDLLFVDEAGQVSLANAIAVSSAARSMVLLGDPQQLDSPLQGSHPDGVEASALQHLLGAHLTLPPDRGIFLPVTWRLAPSICALTSELFYESRLVSKSGLERQVLDGVGTLSGSGLWFADVDHDGNTSASDEEVNVIASLIDTLTAPNARWINRAGETKTLTLNDILIVSPFNAQVSRLVERLPGTRVGTVDKFQGQEAPVVIYSMATSRPEDAPRGMEFLYSPNRFNVATSRARCVVIVVANPRLYEPECHSPRQMQLANALCRYRELAKPVSS